MRGCRIRLKASAELDLQRRSLLRMRFNRKKNRRSLKRLKRRKSQWNNG